jgi:hypothetical protein
MQFITDVYMSTSSILADEFMGKQVVIITDGTDMFDFPFNTKTKKISVISFFTILTSKIKFQNMEDSLKSQPDKEGKVSKLSLFDMEMMRVPD